MLSRHVRPQYTARVHARCHAGCKYELQICINRTCKRQGSEQLLKFVKDLDLPSITGAATGCVGSCGSGPNVVLLPNEQLLHHVATPNDLAEVLRTFCGEVIDDTVLQATQLRLAGNAHAAQEDYCQAVDCYSRALQLKPSVGAHMLYSNRSATYLQAGDKEAALEDARRAMEIAPSGFHNAVIRLIDALFALHQYEEAAEACRQAAVRDSSFKFREEYPVIKRAMQSVGQKV